MEHKNIYVNESIKNFGRYSNFPPEVEKELNMS